VSPKTVASASWSAEELFLSNPLNQQLKYIPREFHIVERVVGIIFVRRNPERLGDGQQLKIP
jgi:hypothetical protein